MKIQKLRSALFLLLVTSTSSFAQDAASIQAALQTYMGSEPGVVTVTGSGDAYDIAIDIAPYLKKITQPGFTAKVDPFKLKVNSKGDGTWAVATSGPWNMSTEVPDLFSFSFGMKDQTYNGVYSTALSGFLESNYDISGITMSQMNIDPDSKIVTNVATGVEKITGVSKATDLGNGTADSQSTYDFSGLVSTTKTDMPAEMAAAGMPNLNYSWTAPTGRYETTNKGVKIKALLDVAAFFVSHPSKELIVKDQAIMKEKLIAALPFLASAVGGYSFDNVVIDTSMGKFGLDKFGVGVNMNGAVKEGRVGETFTVAGLKLPDGLPLPPWSKGLIPTSVNIGFEVSDFDLETPARKFITEMDVSKTEPVPPGSEMAYLAAFAPTNSVKVTIPPGQITADLFTLDYEAVNVVNFAGLPAVTAKISLKGMDAVIGQLQQSAADPTAQQALGGLIAMKGLGKAEADKTVWDIVMGADGKLLVNGTDVSNMLGLAPPPAP
jgi:hypothetical protein